MSVIKATVTISIFVTILASNTANGENEPRSLYNNPNPSDEIPEDNPPAYESDVSIKNYSGIPLSFLQQLSNISTIQELIDKFVDPSSIDERDNIGNRLGTQNIERGRKKNKAVNAKCLPAEKVVPLQPLNPSKDPFVLYFPECTRIPRCGGCCSRPLTCQPTETEIVPLEIEKLLYVQGSTVYPYKYLNSEIVHVEKHTRCQCKCKTKKEDCNEIQEYEEKNCICKCKNTDENQKCLREVGKFWNETSCSCECESSKDCTTGKIFDPDTCECILKQEKIPANSTNRERFIVKAIPVDSNTQYITNV